MGDKSKLSLRKQESLTDVKLIDQIFKSGLSLKAFPLIFSYNYLENKPVNPIQILFSVPKRKFKRAIDRNRIKRLLRESYRINKQLFITAVNEKSLCGAFIFTGNELPDLQTIDRSLLKIISKLHESNRD